MNKLSSPKINTGLLILRIGVGAIFIIAGIMKLITMETTILMFGSMGFAAFWAYLVTIVEITGGIAVLLGIYTRIASLILAIVMIVAMFIVGKDMTLVMTPFIACITALALACTGAGDYAVMRNQTSNQNS